MREELANKLFTSESIGKDNNNDSQVACGYKVGGDYIKPLFLILYSFCYFFLSSPFISSIEYC